MSKKGFRLPTEAEWEYAARFQGESSINAVKHGSVYLTKLNSASGAADNWLNAQEMNEAAWYFIEETERVTHPVGLKKANFLGLYDMSGNVSEWCFDFYADDPTKNDEQYTENEFIVNPQGAAVSDARVIRGGSGNDYAKNCCVGYKDPLQAEEKISYLGFRIVCNLDPIQ